jgi:hypothetical protein
MDYADNAVPNGRGVLSVILNIPILKMGENLKNLCAIIECIPSDSRSPLAPA